MSTIKFLLFETRSFHSTFEHISCHNRPGIRVFEPLLDNQREFAPLSVQESPNLFAFRVLSLSFSETLLSL